MLQPVFEFLVTKSRTADLSEVSRNGNTLEKGASAELIDSDHTIRIYKLVHIGIRDGEVGSGRGDDNNHGNLVGVGHHGQSSSQRNEEVLDYFRRQPADGRVIDSETDHVGVFSEGELVDG